MKLKIFTFSIFLLISASVMAVLSSAQFQGYVAINNVLKYRLFQEDNDFNFGKFIASDDLGRLLGFYSGDGNSSGFQNGNPNATNMAIWSLGFSSLGIWLAHACDPTPFEDKTFQQLDPLVLQSVRNFCQWPSAKSRNKKNLGQLWDLFVNYDAPESEYVAWEKYMLMNELKAKSPEGIIEEAVVTMLLNPHFLLRK